MEVGIKLLYGIITLKGVTARERTLLYSRALLQSQCGRKEGRKVEVYEAAME